MALISTRTAFLNSLCGLVLSDHNADDMALYLANLDASLKKDPFNPQLNYTRFDISLTARDFENANLCFGRVISSENAPFETSRRMIELLMKGEPEISFTNPDLHIKSADLATRTEIHEAGLQILHEFELGRKPVPVPQPVPVSEPV